MIKYNSALYITLFVGFLAYAMDDSSSLFAIREAIRNIHTGVQHQDVVLAGNAVIELMQKKDILKRLTIRDIEGASAPYAELSIFMQLFFHDLVIIGKAELLDIFLTMLDRSYPGIGINWLYYGSSGSYTLLDKAFRLRAHLISAGQPTNNIDQVIAVLIDHGGELYANMADSASAQQGSIGTQVE